ncbi:MAG: hypothetical protein J0H59_12800 [Comamonadaceae bacterium]|nr:hypothetical protein [Comamonadaceae bacterium]
MFAESGIAPTGVIHLLTPFGLVRPEPPSEKRALLDEFPGVLPHVDASADAAEIGLNAVAYLRNGRFCLLNSGIDAGMDDFVGFVGGKGKGGQKNGSEPFVFALYFYQKKKADGKGCEQITRSSRREEKYGNHPENRRRQPACLLGPGGCGDCEMNAYQYVQRYHQVLGDVVPDDGVILVEPQVLRGGPGQLPPYAQIHGYDDEGNGGEKCINCDFSEFHIPHQGDQ